MCYDAARTKKKVQCTFHRLHSIGLASANSSADAASNTLFPYYTGRRKVLWSALKFRVQLQRAVSMNKRRFVQSGSGDGAGRLDLDLTYICNRLIAMAIPCVEGAVYRNDIREVSESPL
jgi:hypothetical protein